MSQLLTDLDRKISATVAHDACRSLPDDHGLSIALPYHFEALPQPIDQGLLLLWVLLHNVVGLQQRVDRLERVVAALLDEPDDTLLAAVTENLSLVAEVRARREAEAKAREAAARKDAGH